MRNRKDTIATVVEYVNSFKGMDDTDDNTYNDEKNKWSKLISDLLEGLNNISISDMEFEHMMDAFDFVCRNRIDEFEKKYIVNGEEAEKKDYDVQEEAGTSELHNCKIDIFKDGGHNVRYFGLLHTLMQMNMRLNKDEMSLKQQFEILMDMAKKTDNYTDAQSIYEENGDYKYISEYQCSKKGAELLESILGVVHEFDGLLRA